MYNLFRNAEDKTQLKNDPIARGPLMPKLKKFEKDISQLVEYDFKDEFSDDYKTPDGRLFSDLDDFEKWLIYKISENGEDCDRSELAMEIYKTVWQRFQESEDQKNWNGETLNSFYNPLISYLTLKANEFQPILHLEKGSLRAGNFFKYAINKNRKINYSATWSNLIYNNYTIFRKVDERIKTYAKTTHTVGNFMPVPRYFNQGRLIKTSDYWDLTLLEIYKYYNEGMSKDSLGSFLSTIHYSDGTDIEQECVIESCNTWLSKVGSWNNFIESYFFQDYVSGKEETGFGEPIMYWANHSFEKKDPETEEDVNQFLSKINHLIIKRGERICNELTQRCIDSKPTPMDPTLEYYNQTAQTYAADTLNADLSELYTFFLSRLPPRATILDLGCGPGRDSLHFLREGYRVRSVDGSPEFCKLASRLTGRPVLCRTFEDIDYTDEFDGIWACASILHVPSTRLPKVLENISRALKKGGLLYASFKYGTFEGDRNGRYFTDMTEALFEKHLAPCGDLTLIETLITADVREGREDEKWLNVLVGKG